MNDLAGTIAEWVRASALSHSEWMVQSSNPSGSRIIYLYIRAGECTMRPTNCYNVLINLQFFENKPSKSMCNYKLLTGRDHL